MVKFVCKVTKGIFYIKLLIYIQVKRWYFANNFTTRQQKKLYI